MHLFGAVLPSDLGIREVAGRRGTILFLTSRLLSSFFVQIECPGLFSLAQLVPWPVRQRRYQSIALQAVYCGETRCSVVDNPGSSIAVRCSLQNPR